jgi:hypothetical protein
MRFILLFTLVFSCFALDVSVEQLSPQERADLIAKLTKANQTPGLAQAEAWAEFGKNVGQALVAGAREVGAATNEFAQTPLGRVVVVSVLFKMFGGTVFKLGAALFLIVVCWGLFWYCYNRVITCPKYEYRPFLWGFWQRRVKTATEDADLNGTDQAAVQVVAWTVAITGGIIIPACLIGTAV